MKVLVTGGGGFIGSNLVDRLIADKHSVLVVDDFSTGRRDFLQGVVGHKQFELHVADLADTTCLDRLLPGVDLVVHLAANADVRWGWRHPRKDIEQNLLVTHNVLESMRKQGVKRLIFSSTGSVYGNQLSFPTLENAASPIQTSLYGASKLSAEALIAAYVEAGHISATILRFVSILGPRYTHGHVFDFLVQLLENPTALKVLGDGFQKKSYLHVSDCVEAIVSRIFSSPSIEVFNLGTDEFCTVRDSVSWIIDEMGVGPKVEFSGGKSGWIGDSPLIYLDSTRIKRTGWRATKSIEQSIRETTRWLLNNKWVMQKG